MTGGSIIRALPSKKAVTETGGTLALQINREDVESLQGRMRKLTERAVDMADICLFVVDARAGLTASDHFPVTLDIAL